MRSDQHRESKKQPSILIDYCLIWWGDTNFCEALCMWQIICYSYIYFVQSFNHVMVKKSRLRRLSNLPKVRELGSRCAGIWETQECLFQDWPVFFHLFLHASIPKAIHILESFSTKLETNKDRPEHLKEG